MDKQERDFAAAGRDRIRAQPLLRRRREKSTLVAVIDTETTGLGERDEPISVGVVLLDIDLVSAAQIAAPAVPGHDGDVPCGRSSP